MGFNLFVILVAIAVLTTGQQLNEDKCKFRWNIEDSSTIASHSYIILEECLYYSLSDKNDKLQGKTGSLAQLPPTRYGRDVDRNEMWREMHINGYFGVQWKDWRLKWDTREWKTDTLKLKSFGHIWTPDLYSDRYQSSVQASDYTTYTKLKSDNKGNVTGRLQFRFQMQCETDYTRYPTDKHTCCTYIKSALFGDIIQMDITNEETVVNMDDIQTNWHITPDDVTLKVEKQDSDKDAQQLLVCVNVMRKSSTLQIELTLPMAISAILLLISHLFGPIRHQCYVKMFALLLQFLSFQFLVEKTPQVGLSGSTPVIYIFYEFTMCITMISLLLAVIIWSLWRMPRELPPPHSAKLFATSFNRKIFRVSDTGENANEANKDVNGQNYSADWSEIFTALNLFVTTLLMIIYFIGIVIMLA